MKYVKYILTILLSISILTVGFPVLAKPNCPMMQMQKASVQSVEKHCDGCPEMQKQKNQKKLGCCDDAACNIKCSATSTMSLSRSVHIERSQLMGQMQHVTSAETVVASHHPGIQDRPPKHLS